MTVKVSDGVIHQFSTPNLNYCTTFVKVILKGNWGLVLNVLQCIVITAVANLEI